MSAWALAVQLQTPERERSPNPARDRGLRRARRTRAPCEPAAWTPLPAAVEPLVALALLTRVRAARTAADEISPGRLYDVRSFKAAVALLGYLRTLTRRQMGGTIVTSMPQLVQGLARMRGAWTMTGDKFADRDRHQQTVRRALRDLDAMGLLRWRIGVDVDGEDARTELELRPAPDVTDDELAAAAAALARWQARYGAALNTGSSTGIRNAAGHARPLSAGERQRRGVARARTRANRLGLSSETNSAPRFATPTPSENSKVLSTNHMESRSACGARSGARTRQNDGHKSQVTRHPPSDRANPEAAISVVAKTASLRMGGSGPLGGPESSALDELALQAHVVALLAARQPVWEMIAAQAAERAAEAASWNLDRGWPVRRLREAWVVWRYGSLCAGELGAAPAGRLESQDPERLRRVLERYERHAAARPPGFPAGGLAVLAVIAAIAAQRDARPQTLHYAIRLLDQLSRRMRAAATVNDPRRRERATARARRRHDARLGEALPFAFRTRPWPPWVALDDNGDPLLDDDHELVLVERPGIEAAPDPQDPCYQQTLRDAQLIAGLWPHAELDGRTTMAQSGSDYDLDDARRRARPGPYHLPADGRARAELRDLRLAQLAAMPLATIKRLSPQLRDELLERYTIERAEQRRAECHALAVRLAGLGSVDRGVESGADA